MTLALTAASILAAFLAGMSVSDGYYERIMRAMRTSYGVRVLRRDPATGRFVR